MTLHRISRQSCVSITCGSYIPLASDDQSVPENPPRGLGIEIRPYDCDPDTAVKNAEAHQYHVLEPAITKPHGLREAFIQCHDGYVWCPSMKS